jgi:hypothetical protein
MASIERSATCAHPIPAAPALEDRAVHRWVLAGTTPRAHLDPGERSSQSLRAKGDHIIVTACRAHLKPDAEPVPESHTPCCSNCLRIARQVRASARIANQEDKPSAA